MNLPVEQGRPSVRRRLTNPVAIRVLAAIAIGTVLYFGRSAFIPIALALLLSLVLTTPVEALHRRGMPRSLATVLILLLGIGLVGEAAILLWTPAHSWWVSAPRTIQTIEHKLQPLSRVMVRLEFLTNRAGQLGEPASARARSEAAARAAAPAPAPTDALALLHSTGSAAISVVAVIILTTFLLSGGPAMFARMSTALAKNLQLVHTVRIIDAVRHEVGRYYATIALINLGLGLATAAVTALLGMPNPLLWGAIAGLLNFLPYVGSATTLLLLSIVAFVTFDTLGRVAAVAGSYLTLATIEGQLVQPLFVGRRLELNPIIVFLALWFGGWFWGVAGIVIAIPSLVALKVVAEESVGGHPLHEFLSPNVLSRFHPKQVSASWGRGRDRRAVGANRAQVSESSDISRCDARSTRHT
jgi:predicted PurR-regulated permease PerM